MNADSEALQPVAGKGELTETERVIAAVWADVLELPSVDVHDDFFDLGGNSIAAARITGRLREELAMPVLPLMLIFEHSTVVELAHAVDDLRLDDDKRR